MCVCVYIFFFPLSLTQTKQLLETIVPVIIIRYFQILNSLVTPVYTFTKKTLSKISFEKNHIA